MRGRDRRPLEAIDHHPVPRAACPAIDQDIGNAEPVQSGQLYAGTAQTGDQEAVHAVLLNEAVVELDIAVLGLAVDDQQGIAALGYPFSAPRMIWA